MELNYVKGDLFALAPKGAYLAHACNCQGVWGSGIAKTFKDKFPDDYKEYKAWCQRKEDHALGTALITSNRIICLHVSSYYGSAVSDPDDILVETFSALCELENKLPQDAVVYSNKFNSGLFNVPWIHTKYFLNCFLNRRPDVKWTVVDYARI